MGRDVDGAVGLSPPYPPDLGGSDGEAEAAARAGVGTGGSAGDSPEILGKPPEWWNLQSVGRIPGKPIKAAVNHAEIRVCDAFGDGDEMPGAGRELVWTRGRCHLWFPRSFPV